MDRLEQREGLLAAAQAKGPAAGWTEVERLGRDEGLGAGRAELTVRCGHILEIVWTIGVISHIIELSVSFLNQHAANCEYSKPFSHLFYPISSEKVNSPSIALFHAGHSAADHLFLVPDQASTSFVQS